MTYVEFYDEIAVENICASLVQVPERVILVGGDRGDLAVCAERCRRILKDRGYEVAFICRSTNRNKLSEIVKTLAWVVESFEDCVFDLTGGEDLFLVAVGIIKERYPEKTIQLQRVNLYTNRVSDCDGDGTVVVGAEPSLTVEENIRVYGGEVVYDSVRPGTTYCWDMNEAFGGDIRTIWDICRADTRLWNRQIGVLKALSECGGGEGSLRARASVAAVEFQLQANKGPRFTWTEDVLRPLYEHGYLTAYRCDGDFASVTYRDEPIRRCLTKEGQALEMIVYLAALTCRDGERPVYNDVTTGVSIDWDGNILDTNGRGDTNNEIDVMMMHGAIPVFVSCKNGFMKMDELYKLQSVAERFGPKYARKVLVAPGLEFAGAFAADVKLRAAEMGIRVIEDIAYMDENERERVVRSFWKNP